MNAPSISLEVLELGDEWMTPNELERRSGSKSKKYKESIKFRGRPLSSVLFVEDGKLSIRLNDENQNSQQEPNFFPSESCSIQIPAKKIEVEIEYKLLKKGSVIYECKMCSKFFVNFKLLCDHCQTHDVFVFPFFSKCKNCKKDTAHEDFNENDFKEHSCQEIQEVEKQPTIKSNVENSSDSTETEHYDQLSEKSVQSNENQNSQQESNLFCSSSIQIPVRKKMPSQARIDIVFSIQEKGILYGCKICFPHRVFTNFRDLYEHFKKYKEFFTHYTYRFFVLFGFS